MVLNRRNGNPVLEKEQIFNLKIWNIENRIAENDIYLLILKNERTKTKRSRAVTFLANVTKDITFLTMESLILAQDERWRRALYMQVEREVTFG